MEISEKILQEYIERSNEIFDLAALFNRDTDAVWFEAKKAYLNANKELLVEVLLNLPRPQEAF